MMNRVAARALAGLPSMAAAAGFTASLVRTSVPRSLVEAIGAGGFAWIIGIIAMTATSAVLEVTRNRRRPQLWMLRVHVVVHIAAATMLAGYAAALFLGPTSPAITIGLVCAAALLHLGQWHRIIAEEIPAIELVEALQRKAAS